MHSKLARDTERAQKQLIEKNVHRKVKRNIEDEEEQREKTHNNGLGQTKAINREKHTQKTRRNIKDTDEIERERKHILRTLTNKAKIEKTQSKELRERQTFDTQKQQTEKEKNT